MASKKGKKSTKMDLGSFYAKMGVDPEAGSDTAALPTAPRGKDVWEAQRAQRDAARNDRDRDGGGGFDDMGPSRADDGVWRRGPAGGAPQGRGGGGFNRGGFGGRDDMSGFGDADRQGSFRRERDPDAPGGSGQNEQDTFGRSDDANEWRRTGPPSQPSRPAGGDERYGQDRYGQDRFGQDRFGQDRMGQDRVLDRSLMGRVAPPQQQPDYGRADEADRWRRTGAAPAPSAPAGAPRQDDDDWRTQPSRPLRVAEHDRYQRPQGYKRLNLKSPVGANGDESQPSQNDEQTKEDAAADKPVEAPVAEAPKPVEAAPVRTVTVPLKTKKLEKGAKLDPFGGARAMEPENKIESVPTRAVSKTGGQPAAAAAPYRPPTKGAAGAYVPPGRSQPALAPTPSRFDQAMKKPEPVEEKKPVEEKPVVPEKAPAKITELAGVDPLELAVRERADVSLEQLKKGLPLLALNTDESQARLGVVISNSVTKEEFKFSEAVELLKGADNNINAAALGHAITSALEHFKSLKGEDGLKAMVSSEKLDLDQLGITFTADLMCLKAGPDLRVVAETGLKAGKDPSAVLAQVQAAADSKVDSSVVEPIISAAMFKACFAEKKKADLAVLDRFAPLAKWAVQHSRKAQVDCMIAGHVEWFAQGAGAPIKEVYQKLVELGVLSADAVLDWKGDEASKKAKGKQKAFIKCVGWVNDLAAKAKPKVHVDDEEDDETDIPEYHGNRDVRDWK